MLDIARVFRLRKQDILDYSDVIFVDVADAPKKVAKSRYGKANTSMPSKFGVISIEITEYGLVTTIKPIIDTPFYDGKDKIRSFD